MDNIVLGHGAHRSHEHGVCVMEAVAWFAGEVHSDAPQCACPVIAAFARQLNDRLDDEQRQRLIPLIPALALSRADWPTTLKRAFIAADYAVRVFAPIALDARGRNREASALRGLAPIVDHATAKMARASAADAAYAADAANAADAALAAAAYAAATYPAYADADAALAAAADAARAAAAYAAARAAAAHAMCPQRLEDLGIECLEKMLETR